VAGRNRVNRKLMLDNIRRDPEWNNGNYTKQPYGLRAALGMLMIIGSDPIRWQRDYPTAELTDRFVDKFLDDAMKTTDANDFLYQYDASRNYDPSPDLEKITTRVLLINVQDDYVNPPELGIAEREIKRVKNGKFVLLPISEKTRAHYTVFQVPAWEEHLADLMKISAR
jgi:homoserine O-acetyltransferase